MAGDFEWATGLPMTAQRSVMADQAASLALANRLRLTPFSAA
jgi:hypothetical protein